VVALLHNVSAALVERVQRDGQAAAALIARAAAVDALLVTVLHAILAEIHRNFRNRSRRRNFRNRSRRRSFRLFRRRLGKRRREECREEHGELEAA
jgi:hypothetical protein